MRLASSASGSLVVAILLLAVSACGYSATENEAATKTEVPENEYGLEVIDDEGLYLQTVAEDPTKELVDLEEEIPGIRLDIRYATTDNFMEEQLYPVAKSYLRAPAADSLAEVQEDLRERGLELKVFDAYRPYEVTERIWEPYQDPDFVADPAEGSRHNRGCAVDATLVPTRRSHSQPRPTARGHGEPRIRSASYRVVALRLPGLGAVRGDGPPVGQHSANRVRRSTDSPAPKLPYRSRLVQPVLH